LALSWARWKSVVFGRPLKSGELSHEQVNVLGGLSLMSPDALSSVAYGTQEILITLMPLGAAALWYSLPISAVIVLLLAFLVVSYRQIIRAYPDGGGAYVIGRDTLGYVPGLMAGAALLVDYTLTVAVSVTAGVAALIAAFPDLAPDRVPLCVAFVVVMGYVNLRGVRESAAIFALPTYLFIALVLVLVGVALVRPLPTAPTAAQYLTPPVVPGLSAFLLLRAFSSGSSALTGVEAISNGVPVFRPPSAKRARLAMLLLGLFLGSMFLGTSVVAYRYGIVMGPNTTVLQLLAARVFGRGWYFYLLALDTMGILAVAANTSFAGFPQLANIMARDKWLPRMFLTRGDRLVYQNGIIVLGLLAVVLVWAFQGDTDRLIPLYAIGVYMSFTIAQLGLVHRYLHGPKRPRLAIAVAAVGAGLTALVVLVAAVAKFTEGAWIVLLVLPLLLYLFRRIHRHYDAIADELRLTDWTEKPEPSDVVVVVPFSGINKLTLATLGYALSVGDRVLAVHVVFSDDERRAMEAKWARWNPDPRIRLVVLESQYRSVVRPVVRYLDLLAKQAGPRRLMVLVPEFVVGRFWQHLLHNQVGLLLQAHLIFRRDMVVAVVPYRLSGR
jgi:amino acid transporter